MRIVSKFKDYYDVGMGLGYDPSIVYVRETKEIPDGPYVRQWEFMSAIVGFCGVQYPCLVAHYRHLRNANKHGYMAEGHSRTVCYSIEHVDGFVEEHYTDEEKEWYYNSTRNNNRRQLEHSFSQRQSQFDSLFAEHNAPIFVVDFFASLITINPLLRPWEFWKVFDAYTAYQEISMYVGGVLLAPVNPVPAIPDDVIRDVKGFDKWSFRKEPTKGKR